MCNNMFIKKKFDQHKILWRPNLVLSKTKNIVFNSFDNYRNELLFTLLKRAWIRLKPNLKYP